MEGRSFSSIWFQASSANREQQICPYREFYSQINKPLTCAIVDRFNASVLWRSHGHSPATAAARHHSPCPHGSAKLPANRVDPTPIPYHNHKTSQSSTQSRGYSGPYSMRSIIATQAKICCWGPANTRHAQIRPSSNPGSCKPAYGTQACMPHSNPQVIGSTGPSSVSNLAAHRCRQVLGPLSFCPTKPAPCEKILLMKFVSTYSRQYR